MGFVQEPVPGGDVEGKNLYKTRYGSVGTEMSGLNHRQDLHHKVAEQRFRDLEIKFVYYI